MDNSPALWLVLPHDTDVLPILGTLALAKCTNLCFYITRIGCIIDGSALKGVVSYSPLRKVLVKLSTLPPLTRAGKYRPWARKIGQLWYEIFDFSCNRSPQQIAEVLEYSDTHQLIMCMHPHGIVPFHAWLWAAYADQYLSDKVSGRALYGFGAAADAVGYVPGLRNIMGWLSAGSATYKVLKDGLTKVGV